MELHGNQEVCFPLSETCDEIADALGKRLLKVLNLRQESFIG